MSQFVNNTARPFSPLGSLKLFIYFVSKQLEEGAGSEHKVFAPVKALKYNSDWLCSL